MTTSGERRLITAEGYTLSAAQEDTVLALMRDAQRFQAHRVIGWLHGCGVPREAIPPRTDPWGPAHRIADRLMQRERKTGRIKWCRTHWTFTAAADIARADPDTAQGGQHG